MFKAKALVTAELVGLLAQKPLNISKYEDPIAWNSDIKCGPVAFKFDI